MRISDWSSDVCSSDLRNGICQPSQERALTPMSCSAIASRPTVTCSPEATTTSYSRASYSRETSPHHLTSWLVVPDIADTTPATSLPASTSRLTRRATLLIRPTAPTAVPPNLLTIRDPARPVCRPLGVTPPPGQQ